jgi:hypothetical protein
MAIAYAGLFSAIFQTAPSCSSELSHREYQVSCQHFVGAGRIGQSDTSFGIPTARTGKLAGLDARLRGSTIKQAFVWRSIQLTILGFGLQRRLYSKITDLITERV